MNEWFERIIILLKEDRERDGTKSKFLYSVLRQMGQNPYIPTQGQLVLLERFWKANQKRKSEAMFGVDLAAEVNR